MVWKNFRELKGSKICLFWYKFDIFDQKGIILPISSQKFENPTRPRFLSANLGLGKFLIGLIRPLHQEDK